MALHQNMASFFMVEKACRERQASPVVVEPWRGYVSSKLKSENGVMETFMSETKF